MKTLPASASWLFVALLFTSLFACPKYDRASQYGAFIHWGDCQDTRAKVLIRDNKGHLSFRDAKTCVVDSGQWIDPYSGDTLFAASDLEIDHVVALSEAHKSGAWAWAQEKRKAYTNFLDSTYHLLAVKGALNSSKGDRDPAEWLPPNKTFIHEYALDWVKIKTQWGLTADSKELSALRALLPGENIQYPEEEPEDICTDAISIVTFEKTKSGVLTKNIPLDLIGRYLGENYNGPLIPIYYPSQSGINSP